MTSTRFMVRDSRFNRLGSKEEIQFCDKEDWHDSYYLKEEYREIVRGKADIHHIGGDCERNRGQMTYHLGKQCSAEPWPAASLHEEFVPLRTVAHSTALHSLHGAIARQAVHCPATGMILPPANALPLFRIAP
jgi:uncharacterized protein YktA (UPF0223 family)